MPDIVCHRLEKCTGHVRLAFSTLASSPPRHRMNIRASGQLGEWRNDYSLPPFCSNQSLLDAVFTISIGAYSSRCVLTPSNGLGGWCIQTAKCSLLVLDPTLTRAAPGRACTEGNVSTVPDCDPRDRLEWLCTMREKISFAHRAPPPDSVGIQVVQPQDSRFSGG
jgi:hypothetical protein